MFFISLLFITTLSVCALRMQTHRNHKLVAFTLNMGFFSDLKQNLVKKLAGDYDTVAISAQLDRYIASSKGGVTMLTFETCPFCVKAREVRLAAKNIRTHNFIRSN